MVRNRDSNFEREIAVFSHPQAGVVTGISYAAEILAKSKILFGGNSKAKSPGAIFHK